MKPTTRDGVLRGGMAVGIRLLIATAAGISAYLLSVSLSGGNAVGCAPGSSCDEVLQSNWAYVFGIPVSGLALLVDLAFLFTTFACGPRSTPQQRRSAWEILIPCAVLVLGAAIWFTALQAFIVQRFCPWCMAAHGAGALAAILLLARMPLTEAPAKTGVHKNKVVKLAAGALIALALLGTAQTLSPRKTYSVTHVPNTSPGDASKSAAVSTRPAPPPVLTLFNGRIVLDLTKTPVIGSPEAPLKLLSLYDYTCRHCREMHPHVLELHRNFSNAPHGPKPMRASMRGSA
jgi:uncharacterized membrane protein